MECLLSLLYSSIQVATEWRACSRVAKWLPRNNFHSRVELNASLTALFRVVDCARSR